MPLSAAFSSPSNGVEKGLWLPSLLPPSSPRSHAMDLLASEMGSNRMQTVLLKLPLLVTALVMLQVSQPFIVTSTLILYYHVSIT